MSSKCVSDVARYCFAHIGATTDVVSALGWGARQPAALREGREVTLVGSTSPPPPALRVSGRALYELDRRSRHHEPVRHLGCTLRVRVVDVVPDR